MIVTMLAGPHRRDLGSALYSEPAVAGLDTHPVVLAFTHPSHGKPDH